MVIAVESFISWSVKSIPFARSFPRSVLKLPSHLCTHAIICRYQDADVRRNQAGFLCVPVVPQDKGEEVDPFLNISPKKTEKQDTATVASSSSYVDLQGSDIVYDTFLRPMVMQYEPNIEQRLLHLRARSGQLLTFYIQNFADKGTAFFMDVLRSVVSDEPAASVSEVTRQVITPSNTNKLYLYI